MFQEHEHPLIKIWRLNNYNREQGFQLRDFIQNTLIWGLKRNYRMDFLKTSDLIKFHAMPDGYPDYLLGVMLP